MDSNPAGGNSKSNKKSRVGYGSVKAAIGNLNQETKQTLYKISYFVVRYFIVFITIWLFVICLTYAISALITTNKIQFFCDYKTAEEVHQHNREMGNNMGEEGSCWYIERPTVDYSKLRNFNNLFQSQISPDSFVAIVACIVFSVFALFLIFIGLQNAYYVIYDTLYTFVFDKPNPRVVQVIIKYTDEKNFKKKMSVSTKMIERKNKSCFKKLIIWIEYLYDEYCRLYEKYLYFDSKYKVFNYIIWEIIEIYIQFYALCLYGGLNLFIPDSVVIAQEYQTVETFAIIVGTNCLVTGVSWIMYIVWHETWYVYGIVLD